MTMANVSSPARQGVSLRKTNKPLMEKRRRARINDSLSQLKSLVIQSSKKDSSQFNKLEKADILELTVKHLRLLQEQQMDQTNSPASLAGKYQAGFVECANEVIRYLGHSHGFNDDVKSRVIQHLASCIQLSNKISIAKSTPPQMTSTPIKQTQSPTLHAGVHSLNGQRPSGQIIQIVNNQFQNVKPSNSVTSYTGIEPTSLSSTSASFSTNANPTSTSGAPSYNKYTLPLQIQIPPVLSPILVQPKTKQQLRTVQPQIIHKPQDSIFQMNPREKLHQNPSPSSHSSSTLPTRCQKSTSNYYSFENQCHDFAIRSRTYSLSSSATSSSASSPESELSSPLNLSQSPKYYDNQVAATHKSQSPLDNTSPLNYTYKSHQSEIMQPTNRDSLFLAHCLSSNFTSVIVDGRKAGDGQKMADGHSMSYMHFMEEERHFVHSESSTSPASSVGEERLWRPW